MDVGQSLTIGLIVLVLGVSLLNPGGWIVAVVLAILILAVYASTQFFPEYILVTNQGKKARKNSRQRRASGLSRLNPFKRSGPRNEQAARQEPSQQGGRDE